MIARTQTMPGSRYALPRYFKILIIGQAFAAFLTETRFLPVKHNVGMFEMVSVALFFVTIIYFAQNGLPFKGHRVMLPLFLLSIATGVSNFNIMSDPSAYLDFRILSCVILITSFVMVVMWYNVFLLDYSSLELFLRAITYSAAIIAAWVLFDQITSGGTVGASGPFRNRAHAGIYLHTAFWLVLLRANWPGRHRWERFLTYPIVVMLLYVISTSGRRSIYISIAGGFIMLAVLSLFTRGKARLRLASLILVSLAGLGLVYFKVSDFWKPAAFFKERVSMVDDRISTFSGLEGEESEDTFVIQQRIAGLRAFREHPLFGIGYGGFPKWEGNPTAHEMHSTPTRFLAETGIVGLALYVWWMIEIFLMALRTWWANLKSPYEAAAMILLVAVTSVSVSSIYNRAMTDRSFWLLLVFGLALETWTRRRTEGQRAKGVSRRATAPPLARMRA